MALQTGSMTPDDWERFFIEAGISTDSAKTHATKFADEKLTIENLQMLDRSMLKELRITLMGEALCILKQAKEDCTELRPALFLSASWTLYGGMCYCYSTQRTASAVTQAKQCAWTKWNDSEPIKLSWKSLIAMEPLAISFLLRSTYDLLPNATNLKLWGYTDLGKV